MGKWSTQPYHTLDFDKGKRNNQLCASSLSHVQLFANPWNVAHQVSLSMEFFMSEYWIELPFPPPGYFPNPEIKLVSPASPALSGRFGFFTSVPPGNPSYFPHGGSEKYNPSLF